ncbi:MAG: PHP domain-containing protein [Gammaproteobacteria bacterium]|nr:PHP domain-containing protein [Gammaproteobacteria bacterium]
MNRIYDLHCHSTASDGSLSPTELVSRAHEMGVNVLALTDHDVTSGLEEAEKTATDLGMGFVPGIEISVTWSKSRQTVHIVGLHVDRRSETLQQGLKKLREFRNWRAEEIGRRLAKKGIEGAYDGACEFAGGEIISRTHFARFLIEQGYAKDMRDCFKHYLVKNKPGHVPGDWASLEAAVGWITGSGGQAVIAHPARYKMTATRLRNLIGEFKEVGGTGFEVVSGTHSKEEIGYMGRLAQQFELQASCGSDFHSPSNVYLELGRLPPLPEVCVPIWDDERWSGIN